MSDEKTEKKPTIKPHEGQRVSFVRFTNGGDLPHAGNQISHAKCGIEAEPAGRSYTCSYHGAAGMYELRAFTNGALADTFWIPRERIAYHQVLA